MAAHSEIIGNEVYVYMNGSLLYKKWLTSGRSVLFSNQPNWPIYNNDPTMSITDANKVEILKKRKDV